MKILVLSDSHRILSNSVKILKKLHKNIDAVIHLGDNSEDACSLSSMHEGLPFYYVRGNCDSFLPEPLDEKEIVLGGKKIIITHGHNYGVKSSYDRICYYALEKGADICLFGHTHVPEIINESSLIVMNPGSVSIPRNGALPTYGMLDISDGIITPSIVQIDDTSKKLQRCKYELYL